MQTVPENSIMWHMWVYSIKVQIIIGLNSSDGSFMNTKKTKVQKAATKVVP